MSTRIIKRSWWVDFRVGYIRYRVRSPDNSRAGAAAFEAVLRQRLARGEPLRDNSTLPTFAQFAVTWFSDYVVVNNKPSEQRSKHYMLNAALVPFFGRMRVDQIAFRDIEQYKARASRAGTSNKTINNRLTVLNTCLVTAYEWFGLEKRPPRVKKLKCPPARTDYLSWEESRRLLDASNGITHDMILLALRTGMRQGEIKGLQWTSIDWQRCLIVVRHSRYDRTGELGSPKSNRERYIPMHPDVFNLLARRKREEGYVFEDPQGRPFNHMKLERRLTAACQNAKLRRISWHALRHSFASHLASQGVPLGAVQALLGHQSITTTMRYSHLAPSILRSAIDMLTPANENFGQPAGNRWIELQKAA